ncbi:MAG TPA: methyltransferase domain-containing protein [Chloroflexota bacterium]|nr:methyltransferase domain-containing protein [Chloroflexota bacterium]
MPRVDYDQIAHLYDEPIRDHAVDTNLLAFLDERPDLDRSTVRVLDVGCGTGKQLTADRARLPGALLVGVDRFRGMLRIAGRRGPGIGWVQGDGAHLPLASTAFDYATSQFSYQHIAGRESFVREIYRVLSPGGRFVMLNIDPWSMTNWAIYQYFPEAFERDLIDFVPGEALAELMQETGFVDVRIERQARIQRQDLAEFLAYVADRHRTSQLMVISVEAYRAGLVRLRRDVDAAGDGEASIDSEACLLTISGDRPASHR